MPSWVPVSVPDLCPRCGAYWECEHALGNALDVESERMKGVADGFASVEGPGTALTVEDMQAAVRQIKAAPEAYKAPTSFDPNVQPVLRYIDEDEDDA